MKRRNAIKGMAMLPIAPTILSGFPQTGIPGYPTPSAVSSDTNIFRSLGIEPIINCRGTFTIIGGSLERPAVREAMEAASHNFIHYDELAEALGQRFADLTGAEWGMVSAGCAAGLKHVTAACVSGGDPEKLIRIPNIASLQKTEVIIPRYSRNAYDHSIRNVGVTIVQVSTPDELEKAINPKTAMIYLTAGSGSATGQPLSLEVISGIAKSKNIPVLIDAAAENLTIPPVHLKRGATIVAYSGGKALCGPQCAGLMLGDKNILRSAWQASSPHHGPGRDNKVGREEMIGMLAAVEDWVSRDHQGDWKKWLTWLNTISSKVSKIPGVTTELYEPTSLSNKTPVLIIKWNSKKLHITGDEVNGELGMKKPRIAVGSSDKDMEASIQIVSGQMQPGEAEIVADRIYEVLSGSRSARPADLAAPAAIIEGKWKVTVNFFNSVTEYIFDLEQESNWIRGTQTGELSVREIIGTIEGDRVVLRSVIPITGNNVTLVFSGNVSDERISGDMHMGEYGTVTFVAKKDNEKFVQEKVFVPAAPIKTSGWPFWN